MSMIWVLDSASSLSDSQTRKSMFANLWFWSYLEGKIVMKDFQIENLDLNAKDFFLDLVTRSGNLLFLSAIYEYHSLAASSTSFKN